MTRALGGLLPAVLAVTVAACSTPAIETKVAKVSVEQAWSGPARDRLGGAQARVVKPVPAAAAPYPLISAPDIRLAYVKPWTDAAGNRHYGNWVAVPVDNPKWVLPDGSLEPMDNTLPQSRPAPRAR